jgi:3-oxoacyl-[acyl-carrier protein] reductase/meso-butanediol dehydrogenase/(S,S)-butanediol dehydrogenase/diacetyl reductase
VFDFKGKVALVTGAARMRGIGHSTAIGFAKGGANVVVNSRDRPPESYPEEEKMTDWRGLDSVVTEVESYGVRGLGIPADITERKQVEGMVDQALAKFGRIDYLVANAGVFKITPFLQVSDEEWNQIITTNLYGVFYCCQIVLRHMVTRTGGGAIVNVSSVAGKAGGENISAYCASKFGVNGLTQALSKEFGPYNIRVNSVCPGRVNTNMMQADEVWRLSRETGLDIKEAARQVYNDVAIRTPLRRPAFADEIASAILFLCSDEASFITGQCINVDGGRVPSV